MKANTDFGNYLGIMIGYMIVLVMVLASAPAHATGVERLGDGSHLKVESLGQGLTSFGIDDLGTQSDQGWWVDARFRGGFAYDLDAMRFELELEGWTGQVLGDTTSLGTIRGEDTFQAPRDRFVDWFSILPQRASVEIQTDLGVVRLGHQSYGWGLGLLVQDGSGARDFGISMRNNLVERIAFGTKPFGALESAPSWLQNTTGFVAADLVFRDDNASLLAGDVAASAVVGLKVKESAWEFGIIESYRYQTDREDAGNPTEAAPGVRVLTSDVYAKVPLLTDRERTLLSLESEVAYITGTTTRPYLDETFQDGARVQSLGAVTRLVYTPMSELQMRLEAGYASGDQDTRDATYRVFTFHTDYQVGMVLFDQVLPMLTARSVDRIHDPELSKTAPAATRFLVNQGTVRDTRYLYPVMSIRPTEDLSLTAAYLWAFRAADAVDPFQSGINGGYNLGFDGETLDSRELGQEVCLGARYGFNSGDLRTTLIAEGALFIPGAALTSVLGQNITLARAGFSLEW